MLQRKLKSLPNVSVIKAPRPPKVTGDGQKVTGLVLQGSQDQRRAIELEGIFVQIGLLPNTDFLRGTLELSRFGEMIVDAKGQTSVPASSPPATAPAMSSPARRPPAQQRVLGGVPANPPRTRAGAG